MKKNINNIQSLLLFFNLLFIKIKETEVAGKNHVNGVQYKFFATVTNQGFKKKLLPNAAEDNPLKPQDLNIKYEDDATIARIKQFKACNPDKFQPCLYNHEKSLACNPNCDVYLLNKPSRSFFSNDTLADR